MIFPPKIESGVKIMFQSREAFIDALRDSPPGRAVSEATAEGIFAKRQKLAAELAQAEEKSAREWPRAFAASEAAAKAVRTAEKALREANAKLAAVNNEHFRISHEYTSRRDEIEAALAATASPLIADFE